MNGFNGSISHRQAFEWLLSNKDGRLEEAARLRLNEHINSCSECRQDGIIQQRLSGLLLSRDSRSQAIRLDAADRRTIDAVLNARRRQRFWAQAIQTVIWAAAVLLLALVTGWAIERLQPATSLPASGVPGLVFQQQTNTTSSAPATNVALRIPNGLEVGLILAGFFAVLIAFTIFLRRYQTGLLFTFLAGLVGSIILLMIFSASNIYQGTYFILFLFLPLVIIFLTAFLTYVWTNRRKWSVATWISLVVAVFVLGFVFTRSWFYPYFQMSVSWSAFLIFFAFGLIPVIIWQILTLEGRWRWIPALISGLWIFGVLLFVPDTYAMNVHLSSWLTTYSQVAGGLYPIFVTTTVGWLILTILEPRSIQRKYIWLHLAIGLFLFASLIIVLHTTAVDSSTNEDPISAAIMLFFALLGVVTASIVMTNRLPRKRLLSGLTLLLIFFAALIPAVIFTPDQSEAVTQQRAQTINQAIGRYYHANGVYPSTLDALSPDYLILVPAPVTNLTNDWCYVSGGDYYRLGYPSPTKFSYPGTSKIYEFNGGSLPTGPSECDQELQKWIKERYPGFY